ncbi:rhamnogalacturonan acetylesterase [Occultella glacieicola]|uniref:Rhamnogalacturonan acetylesterase n=1 Tax=Occultella glacieicola TaxID=2518684 RepID=A0ABY2DZ38_9MICO|nr:rhamnogalacturonan acetylesterase [Occultella glacieicola]TDE89165.1 rhamnogalacturonan acetylesterase [Occultella glacieicola]
MRILLAGDSTVAACPPHEAPMSGWGAHLATFTPGVVVHNFAKGGATTASLRADGLWDALLWEAAAGDVVLLQFGHNDQKQPEVLGASAGYTANLTRMLTEVREAGAAPVLCTSVQRRRFAGGAVAATHGDYPDAVRDLAAAQRVPLIDLTAATTELYESLGEQGSMSLFTRFGPGEHPNYPDGIADDTHFNVTGATAVARIVADALAPVLAAA